MKKQVIVIGGGASGMTAAYAAAKNGAKVTIIEQNIELGKKILATGNGRCNFTNIHMESTAYYSDEEVFIQSLLTTTTSKNIIPFFEGIGMLVKEKEGYCYPLTEQSITVREALSNQLKKLGVTISLDETVVKIAQSDSCYTVITEKGEYQCNALILSTGGKSGIHDLTKKDGYEMLRFTKHTISPLSPALVGMECQGKFFKKLAGVRTQARVSAIIDDMSHAVANGELQLTSYGVSGIPVFQISRVLSQALLKDKRVEISIDFMPHIVEEAFLDYLFLRRKQFVGLSVQSFMNGLLKDKLSQFIMFLCRVEGEESVHALTDEVLEKMARIIKKFKVTVVKAKTFKESQVTAGGVPLKEMSHSFESKLHKNLYITGEVLNVDGICGGYNLHFAWISGLIAGESCARESEEM